jgi:hypothetical protein
MHKIADARLMVGTYGFVMKGLDPGKDKGGADRLDQPRPLILQASRQEN